MPLMNVSLLIARSSIAHLVMSIQVLSLIHVISCMGNDMGSPKIPDPSAKFSRAVWIRLLLYFMRSSDIQLFSSFKSMRRRACESVSPAIPGSSVHLRPDVMSNKSVADVCMWWRLSSIWTRSDNCMNTVLPVR